MQNRIVLLQPQQILLPRLAQRHIRPVPAVTADPRPTDPADARPLQPQMTGRIGTQTDPPDRHRPLAIAGIIDRAHGRSDPPEPLLAACRWRQIQLLRRAIHQHDQRTGGPDLRHDGIRAGLPPQPLANVPQILTDGFGALELQQFPVGQTAIPDGQHIAARQHRPPRDRGQNLGFQPDPQRCATIDDAGTCGQQRHLGPADHGTAGQRQIELEAAILIQRAIGRDRAGPGFCRHRQPGRMRHLVPAHQRQIQQHRHHRHGRGIAPDRVVIFDRRRGAINAGIDPHRLDGDRPGPLGPVDPPQMRAARAVIDADDIPCPQTRLRRRQGKPRRIAGNLRLGQPAPGDPAPFSPRQDQRKFTLGHGLLVGLIRQHGLGGRGGIIPPGLDMAQPYPPAQLQIGRASDLKTAKFIGDGQIFGGDAGDRQALPHDETQHAIAFDRIETIGQHQGLQGRPPALVARQDIAAHHA